jgi:hypothetical protein
MTVFDQINGMPVHALVLHAAVIFVPLLALLAIVYAFLPRFRSKTGWAALLLAIAAPVSAFAAMASGTKLRERLVGQGLTGPPLEKIDTHMGYGQLTFFFALGLGVVTLVMVLATIRRTNHRLPIIADVGLGIVMLALAAASGYFVVMAGDTGAQAVWGS